MEPDPSGLTRREQGQAPPESLGSAASHHTPSAPSGPPEKPRHRRWWLAVIFLAIAGADLVLVSTARYGAGLSPDSVAYLDVARNLVSGKGFVFWTGEPLTMWPPLYPVLLASATFLTGLDPAALARLVNAALFAVVILLSAGLFRKNLGHSTAYSLLGACAVLLSIPLSEVYAMAWSDCLFIPLVLLYAVSAQRYWHDKDGAAFAMMAVSAGLALLTRYAGVAIVLAGGLTILLAPQSGLRTRVRRASSFAALALLPVGIWLACNQRAWETLLRYEAAPGVRHPGGFLAAFAGNILSCGGTLVSWYIPRQPVWLAWSLLAATGAALAALAAFPAGRRRLVNSVKSLLLRDSPLVLLFFLYVLTTVSSLSAKHFRCEPRYAAPLFVIFTLVLLRLAGEVLGQVRHLPRILSGRIPVLLLALWLFFPLISVARSTATRFKNGAGGYNRRSCRESRAIAYARQALSANDAVYVYSNGPDVLREIAGVNATELPRRAEVSLGQLEGRWPAENGSILVWFRGFSWRRHWYSIEELRQVADIKEVARFPEGTFHWVSIRQRAGTDSGRRPLRPPLP
jgi:4-amino-4-deoxy-L-arabinose transferase-like glycosyltransferase